MKQIFSRKLMPYAVLFLLPSLALAATPPGYPTFIPMLILVIFFAGIITLCIYAIRITGKAAAEEGQTPSALGKWWSKTNNFIPLEEEVKLDTGHAYDGIRELDNKIPKWFTFAFVVSAIWALGYLTVFHVLKASPLSIKEYEIAEANAQKEQEEFLKKAKNKVDENNITLTTEANDIAEGKKAFLSNCVACHAADGGGGVGPNLTDEYWIHGGSGTNIFKVIKYGVIEKGMISWKSNFSDAQIVKIASYVATLKGTSPAAPKAPQGDKYPAEQAETEAAPQGM